jgi:predicted AAA+ superfamily ATPase
LKFITPKGGQVRNLYFVLLKFPKIVYIWILLKIRGCFGMKRYAEQILKKWLVNPYRKPLIIRGARQVGKSTLVRNFAQDNSLNLIEVNLEKHLELDVIFNTFNIQNII